MGKDITQDLSHEELTQVYSTWGDKLLQHTDVLDSIQSKKKFKPITIQLAPLEACDSDCPFCSVAGRPLKSYIPFKDIKQILTDFKTLLVVFKSFVILVIADKSLGKQCPPKPKSPSGPGTVQ